ncbi:hypothetical protein J1N35_040085 [Gossypium stocksii]|uniref:RNase H type-1 domain-containing protein n=1 Tax=Gossypium stocksii TaxID=47602 RepID=A0A9D3UD02_9ROSI|nr:hypothetical protein J1N35_040085 [Gossypium stocksii]
MNSEKFVYHAIRDQVGKWIFDFNRFMGSCFVFEAELWSILNGLDILSDRGYDNVLVQTDSLEVTTAIQEGRTGGSNSVLVRRIL